jgi:hypothetical protein
MKARTPGSSRRTVTATVIAPAVERSSVPAPRENSAAAVKRPVRWWS